LVAFEPEIWFYQNKIVEKFVIWKRSGAKL